MDLTPQRGAFSRVLNRLARNTKIVFSPQRGGFSGALCLYDYSTNSICLRDRRSTWEPRTAILKVEARQAQRLRTLYGHLQSWSAAGAALENSVRPS